MHYEKKFKLKKKVKKALKKSDHNKMKMEEIKTLLISQFLDEIKQDLDTLLEEKLKSFPFLKCKGEYVKLIEEK